MPKRHIRPFIVSAPLHQHLSVYDWLRTNSSVQLKLRPKHICKVNFFRRDANMFRAMLGLVLHIISSRHMWNIVTLFSGAFFHIRTEVLRVAEVAGTSRSRRVDKCKSVFWHLWTREYKIDLFTNCVPFHMNGGAQRSHTTHEDTPFIHRARLAGMSLLRGIQIFNDKILCWSQKLE